MKTSEKWLKFTKMLNW